MVSILPCSLLVGHRTAGLAGGTPGARFGNRRTAAARQNAARPVTEIRWSVWSG